MAVIEGSVVMGLTTIEERSVSHVVLIGGVP
jgi:hypothetical protein